MRGKEGQRVGRVNGAEKYSGQGIMNDETAQHRTGQNSTIQYNSVQYVPFGELIVVAEHIR
jgi:hypothetical protein